MLSIGALGCATATPIAKLRRVDSSSGVVSRLADLRVSAGTLCAVTLADGSTLRGRVVSVSAGALELNPDPPEPPASSRVLSEADIISVGRLVGMTKPARAWVGAAIGAAVSLPLSMSKVGDLALIGALLGTLVGRHIGDQHVEVLFVSPRAPAHLSR